MAVVFSLLEALLVVDLGVFGVPLVARLGHVAVARHLDVGDVVIVVWLFELRYAQNVVYS